MPLRIASFMRLWSRPVSFMEAPTVITSQIQFMGKGRIIVPSRSFSRARWIRQLILSLASDSSLYWLRRCFSSRSRP